MLTIDDIEIKIKKYDREKQIIIVNIMICEKLEIRGFRVRYGRTKYSPNTPIWIASPPSIKIRSKYFWIVEFKDIDLWVELEKRLINEARSYTNKTI